MIFAITPRRPDLVAAAAAYIVAAEGLWRIAGGAVVWEFSKYAVTVVFVCSVLRRHRFGNPTLPLAYFVLLLPAALITGIHYDFGRAREILSSNLSGPLTLTAALLFFASVQFSWPQIARVLQVSLGPLAGMAAVCSSATLRMTADDFGTESNFQASGGFGPNQVSSLLGWGMLLAFLWLITTPRRRWSVPVAASLFLLFAAQAALTFSRTGVYLGVAGILLALLALVRNPRQAVFAFVAAALLATLWFLFIFPALDSMTGGKLTGRFQEKGFSGRDEIAKADLKVFLNHPFLGTGVGLSRQARVAEVGVGHMAHTEYTRLLSEHGLFGGCAVIILLAIALRRLRAATLVLEKAFVYAILSSGLLFMAATGMRLALPSFALGLAMVGMSVPPARAASRASSAWGFRNWNRRPDRAHVISNPKPPAK